MSLSFRPYDCRDINLVQMDHDLVTNCFESKLGYTKDIFGPTLPLTMFDSWCLILYLQRPHFPDQTKVGWKSTLVDPLDPFHNFY